MRIISPAFPLAPSAPCRIEPQFLKAHTHTQVKLLCMIGMKADENQAISCPWSCRMLDVTTTTTTTPLHYYYYYLLRLLLLLLLLHYYYYYTYYYYYSCYYYYYYY